MKKLVLFIVICVGAVAMPLNAKQAKVFPKNGCLQADIIFLTDWSSSVQKYEHFLVLAVKETIESLNPSFNGVHVGIISFADSAEVELPLTDDREQIDLATSYLYNRGAHGDTNMGAGLSLLIQEFADNGRSGIPKIVVIITDGVPTSSSESALAVTQGLKNQGVKIFSINTGAFVSVDFLEKIASPHCYLKADYETLREFFKSVDICM